MSRAIVNRFASILRTRALAAPPPGPPLRTSRGGVPPGGRYCVPTGGRPPPASPREPAPGPRGDSAIPLERYPPSGVPPQKQPFRSRHVAEAAPGAPGRLLRHVSSEMVVSGGAGPYGPYGLLGRMGCMGRIAPGAGPRPPGRFCNTSRAISPSEVPPQKQRFRSRHVAKAAPRAPGRLLRHISSETAVSGGVGRMGTCSVCGRVAYFKQIRFGSILRTPALESRSPPHHPDRAHTHRPGFAD